MVSLSSLPVFGWRSGMAKGVEVEISVGLPTGVWKCWGGWGRSPQLLLWQLGRLWGKTTGHSSHTQTSWEPPPGLSLRVCDWLALGRKTRTWNLQMACGGLRLGDIRVEGGWQRMKKWEALRPKSKAAVGWRSGLPRGQAGPWSGWDKDKGEEAPGIEWEISGKFKHWIRKSEMKTALATREGF